ncbi:hypothetical protein [Roseicitreum antarcticum]|uniref:hypothetical protein n=1 Tax=Roseicitreum antarcticum TaxID=564137 RepID=UPI001680EB3C|nr:hypothetical protein [Roseicitreum antarcticum]
MRSFGVDVERLNEELIEDARFCDANSLILRTDARNGVPGAAPPVLKDKEIKDE